MTHERNGAGGFANIVIVLPDVVFIEVFHLPSTGIGGDHMESNLLGGILQFHQWFFIGAIAIDTNQNSTVVAW